MSEHPRIAPKIVRLASIIAARWTGNGPAGSDYATTLLVASDFLGRQATDDDAYALGDSGMFSDAQEVVETHAMLPRVPAKHFRVNHTFGLRGGVDTDATLRESLLDQIAAKGLVPQPTGSGRSSESPFDVFAVVDYPPGVRTKSGRTYNRNFPWIVADIPQSDIDIAPSWYRHDAPRPGDVVTLFKVPPSMIVGINGIPPARLRSTRRALGLLVGMVQRGWTTKRTGRRGEHIAGLAEDVRELLK